MISSSEKVLTPTSLAIITQPCWVTQYRDGRRPFLSSMAPTYRPSENVNKATSWMIRTISVFGFSTSGVWQIPGLLQEMSKSISVRWPQSKPVTWPVPRFHRTRTPLVKVPLLFAHQGVVLPSFRHHRHHGLHSKQL